MKRVLLAVLALAVIGGAVGLLIGLRSSSDAKVATTPAPTNPDEIVATVPAPVRQHPRVNVTSDEPVGSGAAEETPPNEYTVGDVQVRDHRSGDNKPIDVPPNVHPPEARRIPSSLTSEVTSQIRAAIRECGAQVPPEARGAKPKVDGLITIDIKNKQATVTSTALQMRDVVGAAVEPTRQCIEQKSLGVHVDTTEADLTGYGITISFLLP